MINLDDIQYEDRLIVFMDLLGFRNAVDASVKDDNKSSSIRRDIASIVNYNVFLKQANEESCADLGKYKGLEIMVFSDSIVISKNANSNISNSEFLFGIVWHCYNIYNNNFLVRGGISYGKLVHEGNKCFGPAMNRAYKLESETAIYPRIVIDDVALEYLKDDNLKKEFIIKDKKDKMNYLDILNQKKFIQDGPDLFSYEDILMKLKTIVLQNLNEKNKCNTEIAKKMKWFKKYFNKTTKRNILGKERKRYLIK